METPAEAGRGPIDTYGGEGAMAEQKGLQPPRYPAPVAMNLGSGCFPWTVLAVLIALVSGLFLILGRGGGPGSGHPDGGKQQAYVDEIDEARQQLFKGELVRTSTKSLHLVAGGDPVPYRAQILGSWRSDGAGETHSPTSAGAQIGVKLHCSGAQVRCTPLSSERQNVISKKDTATWLWEVSAEKAGTVTLSVTVTAYYEDTDTVLFEQQPAPAHVEVAARPGDRFAWAAEAWRWISGAITSLGGFAVSVTAVISLAVLVARRTPRAPAPSPATTAPTRTPTRPPERLRAPRHFVRPRSQFRAEWPTPSPIPQVRADRGATLDLRPAAQ